MSQAPGTSHDRSRWLPAWVVWTVLFLFSMVPSGGRLPGPFFLWSGALLVLQVAIHAALLSMLLLSAPALLPGKVGASRATLAAIGAVALLFVYVDSVLYGDFGYHLGRKNLGNLGQQGWMKTLGISPTGALALLACCAAAVVIGVLVTRSTPRPRSSLRWLVALLAADLALGVGSGLARFEGYKPLMGVAEAMPLGFSPDLNPWLSRVFGHAPIATEDDFQFPSSGLLDRKRAFLPATPPTSASRRPNILLIVVESLRADGLGAMPNLRAFAEHAIVGRDHFSGGNCSFLGDFTLLSGLDPSFWGASDTAEAPRGLEAFHALGYHVRLGKSAALAFAMPPRVLKAGFDTVEEIPDPDPLVHDTAAVKWIEQWLRNAKTTPELAVLFFDASHWPYWVPGEPTPSFGWLDGWNAHVHADEYRLRYRRSLASIDARIGQVLDTIHATGQDDSLAVVVVGDHGEAFGEHGVLSHGSRLDDEQLRTPWLMRLPGVAPSELPGPSTHADVLPTLLGYIGASPLPAIPGVGVNLFAADARPEPPLVGSCAISSPDGYAALVRDGKVLMQLDGSGAHYVGFVSPNGAPVARDPNEAEIKAALESELRAWQSHLAPAR